MHNDRWAARRRPAVLLVAPLHQITSRTLHSLRSAGFETRVVDAIPDVLEAVRSAAPAALVLDMALPGLDPGTLLDKLRVLAPELPVIALTSRDEQLLTVSRLRGAGDDYLVMPFPIEELAGRLRLRVRSTAPEAATMLRSGAITVDTELGLVSVGGTLVTLSPTEYAVLVALISHPGGQPVPKDRIAQLVWGRPTSSNLVEVYVGYLRRKLGAERIRTVRRAGYILEG